MNLQASRDSDPSMIAQSSCHRQSKGYHHSAQLECQDLKNRWTTRRESIGKPSRCPGKFLFQVSTKLNLEHAAPVAGFDPSELMFMTHIQRRAGRPHRWTRGTWSIPSRTVDCHIPGPGGNRHSLLPQRKEPRALSLVSIPFCSKQLGGSD